MFVLHPQLAKDCVSLGVFPLSRLLMARDRNYPWFILVPQRVDIKEAYQLSQPDQLQLCRESNTLARKLADYFQADKMNVAALGNQVPQLHIHHIVRFRSDPAWPHPVWGRVPAVLYDEAEIAGKRDEMIALLSGDEFQPD